MRAICVLSAGCLLLTPSAEAAVYRVPADAARITDALALSVDGDVISVGPGTYAPSTNGETFPLEVLHDVILCGAGGGVSILDAEGTASVIVLKASSPRVSGFTITGGQSAQGGGVLVWDNTAPEIDHNLIWANGASNVGSGAFIAEGAFPHLHHNVFWSNFDLAPASGGDPHGLQFYNAGGIVEQNLFGRGDSNGLHVNTSGVTIRNNIFYENGIPAVRGRGICVVNGATPVIAHNLFFGNIRAALLIAPGVGDVSATLANDMSLTDAIYGNQDANPAFADVNGRNWALTANSPAIDAGDPASPLDPDGTQCDVGPYYYPQATSGIGETTPIRHLMGAPNPFTRSTSLSYQTAHRTRVVLTIHDVAGRRVRTLLDETVDSGTHASIWNGTADDGIRVAPGVYFARLQSGGLTRIEPLVITR